MRKQRIRLTESELNRMIAIAVNEALINEGFFNGGMGGLLKKGANKLSKVGQNAGNAIANTWDKAKQSASQTYNSAKKAYQYGSINGDAQKYIKNAVTALNNLLQVDQKFQQQFGHSIIGNGRQRQTIDACVNALNGSLSNSNGAEAGPNAEGPNRQFQQNASISNRFQQNYNAATS